MNYELAKQLKDAGFPNSFPDFRPTLSELIDASKTDDGFVLMGPNKNIPDTDEATPYGLIKHPGGILPNWRAFIRNANDETYADGSTPEVAVAKLWLILNQK